MLNLSDIHRAAFTERWHNTLTITKQDVGSHSFLVAIIADKLVSYLDLEVTEADKYSLAMYNLYHDLEEGILGDFLSPTKALLKQEISGFDEALTKIEDRINPAKKEFKERLNPELLIVAKLADLFDAAAFISKTGLKNSQRDIILSKLNQAIDVQILLGKAKNSDIDWLRANELLEELLGEPNAINELENYSKLSQFGR